MKDLYETPEFIAMLDSYLEEGPETEIPEGVFRGFSVEEIVEGLVKYYQNLSTFHDSIEAELKRIKGRKEKIERKLETCENKIRFYAMGKKFEYPFATLSWRKSSTIDLDGPLDAVHGMFKRVKTEESLDKTAVKEWISFNQEVPKGVKVVEKLNMQIK